jgi:hypothetical protein
MHEGEEIPQGVASSDHESLESTGDMQFSEPDGTLTSRWTTMASAAAGAALGMPFDSRGALRAAWVEVSQRIAALRK